MKKRKIAVVTGTRAEYGLMYWLMKELADDTEVDFQLIVTGMHLSPEFGLTYKQIEADGFHIDARVEMLMSSDTPVGVAKSIGIGVMGFADAFANLQPDLIVVLGDRYEILAAAQAAMIARIPVAHLHGGESCEGLIDEPIRHAITKMSHLHFVAAEPYKQRVIQLGESPHRVFNFGAPGLDHITRSALLDKQQLQQSLDFEFGELNFLITYHNVTLREGGPQQAMKQLFQALERFPEAKVIFTRSNSDTDARVIGPMIENFLHLHPGRGKVYTSLGIIKYLSTVKHVDVVLGNSSSGLIEIPFFKKASINIGDRQRGRLLASSVICCDETADGITQAIEKALSKDFQHSLQQVESPYGHGDACQNIKETLKTFPLDDILMKRFHDVNQTKEGEFRYA